MATARPRPSGYKHIVIDPTGVARIVGTTTKVREVVLDQIAYGWSPEEMHWQHPYLSLAQIHAALTYYHDHKEQVDQEIADARDYAESIRSQVESPALRQKLARLKSAAGRRATP